MLARLLLAGLAVLAAVAGARGLRADGRCADVKEAASTAPRGELSAIARETAKRCGDPRDRVVVAVVLVARKHRPDAVALTRRMTRDDPQDYLGWLALWRLTREPAPLARARALNPRGTPRA